MAGVGACALHFPSLCVLGSHKHPPHFEAPLGPLVTRGDQTGSIPAQQRVQEPPYFDQFPLGLACPQEKFPHQWVLGASLCVFIIVQYELELFPR